MSLFERIFGKRKSQKPINLERIEKELECTFPRSFHELITLNLGKPILLKLPDEDYRVLESITTDLNINDPFEKTTVVSQEMSNNTGWKEKRRLPFARNLSNDQYKYLFFIEDKNGEECSDQIYFTDMDSHIGKLEITNGINIFDSSNISRIKNQNIIDCKLKSIKQIFEKFELPSPISYWEDSFSYSSRKNVENRLQNLEVEQHVINYVFEEEEEEDMARIDINISLILENELLFTNAAYEIDNSNLKQTIEYNNYYRMFYFKHFCIIDALIKTKQIAKEQGIISENDFLNLITVDELNQITKQSFKSVETRYP